MWVSSEWTKGKVFVLWGGSQQNNAMKKIFKEL
jgi:hypothetical protein